MNFYKILYEDILQWPKPYGLYPICKKRQGLLGILYPQGFTCFRLAEQNLLPCQITNMKLITKAGKFVNYTV